MFRRSRAKRTPGQALVEFALAATLIFVLLSAAVDIGLIFFTFQGLRTAAQEGANFGSHPVMVMSGGALQAVDIPYAEVVNRVRYAGGTKVAGFANLRDLNNDGIDDQSQPTVIDPASASSYIYVENLKFPNDDVTAAPSGACATTSARTDMRNAGKWCYVRVTVRYNYKFIFPLAPAFADTITIRATYTIRVRSSFVG
jgi:Flp pilus assembly protein TadG